MNSEELSLALLKAINNIYKHPVNGIPLSPKSIEPFRLKMEMILKDHGWAYCEDCDEKIDDDYGYCPDCEDRMPDEPAWYGNEGRS